MFKFFEPSTALLLWVINILATVERGTVDGSKIQMTYFEPILRRSYQKNE